MTTQQRANEALSRSTPDTPIEQRLALLRDRCGYSPDGDDEGIDALLAYKDALEDEIRAQGLTLASIASGVPTGDSWRSASSYMEFVAEVLDDAEVGRPVHYGN